MATDGITEAMEGLTKYIGSNNANNMIMDLIERNGGLSSNNKENSIGAKILDEFKRAKAKGDYTIFLYNTAHIPAKYDGYTDEINFVDLIRDKMSNVNKAIYEKLFKNDPDFAKNCFCAMKVGYDTTYEGPAMESRSYNQPDLIKFDDNNF